ncbi:MAG: glycosyltransferase family 2 protein [Lachnospiraceae bacterium]|nr:glycosyltransferase family 2 protein [Lachnospiraceae bacterium]
MENTLGIIILNYNGYADTVELIDSIKAHVSGTPYEIIVVDNASKENDADLLEEKYGADIAVLRSPRNKGYAAGNNMGIRHAYERGLKYFCILNNDTVVAEDFFAAMMRYLDLHRDVAFVGPALVWPGGAVVQSTGSRIKRLKAMSYNLNAGAVYADLDKSEIPCDMLVGACMMFTRETLEQIGYLPEVYFLCFEETEWCLKAKDLGKKCVCLPEHYIFHKESVSMNKQSGLFGYLVVRNRVVFAKRTLPLPLFLVFLFYNTCRLILQSFVFKRNLKEQLRYQHDGLTGKIDKRFPFIWIGEDGSAVII